MFCILQGGPGIRGSRGDRGEPGSAVKYTILVKQPFIMCNMSLTLNYFSVQKKCINILEFLNSYMKAPVTVGFGGLVCFYISGKLGFDWGLSLDPWIIS